MWSAAPAFIMLRVGCMAMLRTPRTVHTEASLRGKTARECSLAGSEGPTCGGKGCPGANGEAERDAGMKLANTSHSPKSPCKEFPLRNLETLKKLGPAPMHDLSMLYNVAGITARQTSNLEYFQPFEA